MQCCLSTLTFDTQVRHDRSEQVDEIVPSMHRPIEGLFIWWSAFLATKQSSERSKPSDNRLISHSDLGAPVSVYKHDRTFAINQSCDVCTSGYIVWQYQGRSLKQRGLVVESSFQESAEASRSYIRFSCDLSDGDSCDNARVGLGKIILGPFPKGHGYYSISPGVN